MSGGPSFDQFVVERRVRLLRFAMVLTGDYWLAQEIVTDVLGRAFELWPRIGAVADPNAYVRRMLVNEHISWRRRWARTRPTDPQQMPQEVVDGPDGAVSDRADLVALLAILTVRQRAVVVLRYYEHLVDTEIAEILGCRVETVRSHASRALQRLRLDLARSEHDLNTVRKEPTR